MAPTARFPTVVWRSGDGGRTWAPTQDGYDRQNVNAFATGRDGKLYMGGNGGVWRTRFSLVTAGATPPEALEGAALTVRPNPSRGRVSVALTLAAPSRVRLSVFDTLGREVAVLLDGPVGAGERVVHVDTSAWPAGVYVVRASAGARVASARLVVVR